MFKVILSNLTTITEDRCKWIDLPNVPILSLEYQLPNKKTLHLSGFENYILIKQIYKIIYGGNGERIDDVNILGKYGNEVYQFSLNLYKGKAKQCKNVWGKEFRPLRWNPVINDYEFGEAIKTNYNLWKQGLKLEKQIVKIY